VRSHLLHPGRQKNYGLKNDFCNVDKAIFQSVEMPYELIFCILGFEKSEFDEFPEVMF
jgi:hypothetical protein